jgi:hypothetical protein
MVSLVRFGQYGVIDDLLCCQMSPARKDVELANLNVARLLLRQMPRIEQKIETLIWVAPPFILKVRVCLVPQPCGAERSGSTFFVWLADEKEWSRSEREYSSQIQNERLPQNPSTLATRVILCMVPSASLLSASLSHPSPVACRRTTFATCRPQSCRRCRPQTRHRVTHNRITIETRNLDAASPSIAPVRRTRGCRDHVRPRGDKLRFPARRCFLPQSHRRHRAPLRHLQSSSPPRLGRPSALSSSAPCRATEPTPAPGR